jgi:hypothetical protein
MVTDADSEVGGVQLPLVNLSVVVVSTESNALLVLTVT